MTKAVKMYHDTKYNIQVVKSETGLYFDREWGWNGYTYGWSKWHFLGKIKSIKRELLKWEDKGGREFKQKHISMNFELGENHMFKLAEKVLNHNAYKRLRLPA